MTEPDREKGAEPGQTGEGGSVEGSGRGAPQPIADLDFLRGLIAAVEQSGIDSLEVSRGGTRIRISKTPGGTTSSAQPAAATTADAAPLPANPPSAPAAAGAGAVAETPAPPAAAPVANNWVEVKSPMVGTFYRAPSPEAPPYVEVGSRVSKGQTLCILEAMKLMNELEAESSGIVREIAVDNGEPVEYGQVLFRIEPEE